MSGAPIFPNLVQEAKLGYDVAIGLPAYPLFFQFKLPDVMRRNNAKEIGSPHFAGLTVPYFRLPLMRRDVSEQHQRLIDHEGRYPNQVYYVMGCLGNQAEFNASFIAASVHSDSVFFSPRHIGPLPDDKDHVIVYKPWSPNGWFCSEPQQVSSLQFNKIDGQIREGFAEDRFRDVRKVAKELRSFVIDAVAPAFRELEGEVRQRVQDSAARRDGQPRPTPEVLDVTENLLVAHQLARVGLGVEILIAQPKA